VGPEKAKALAQAFPSGNQLVAAFVQYQVADEPLPASLQSVAPKIQTWLSDPANKKRLADHEACKEIWWPLVLSGLRKHWKNSEFPPLGPEKAKVLSQAFPSTEQLADAFAVNRQFQGAGEQNLADLEGIGPEIAFSLQTWFGNPANQKLLERLAKAGLQLQSQTALSTESTPGPLTGQMFVLTGTLPSLRRVEAQKRIEAAGGTVSSSVSRKTTHLVAGANPGSKLDKARSLGLAILDEDDHLYCGTRHGDIVRYFAPEYRESEIYAHIGGFPLGLAFDRDGSLKVCVGAMGLYSVSPDRRVERLSAETNRSWLSVVDDARLRDPNDLDIGSDGRIYFTDSTTRYDAHEWATDSVENRPTGRVLVYDPETGRTRTLLRRLNYPNGVCMAHDGESFFFAESWECRVNRYWYRGPKTGRLECVIRDMPGYPDNINRASDGAYWMAWLGMRTPTFDLMLRRPGARRRMTRRLPKDDWLFPNINTGGVVKFDESGRILTTLGDLGGKHHPMVTSMREHKGYLYVGGILNNRIGRYKLHDADERWTGMSSYRGRAP